MRHAPTGSVLVYNGEIYNYLELRAELESLGMEFRSDSDTEVLLLALEHWGPEGALRRLNGMWAFAWLDAANARIVLSRDRCGEKPLYMSVRGDTLEFASELKSILKLSGLSRALNHGAVLDFLALGLVNTSAETMLDGVTQVEPGTCVSISLSARELRAGVPMRYWHIGSTSGSPVTCCGEFIEQCRVLLRESVRIRLRSDVPVGVLLSGGLDSSAVTAAAVQCGQDVALYSLRNADPAIDESPYASAVADRLGLRVNWLTMPSDHRGLMDDLTSATWMSDAPIPGFSIVALYQLMRMAREAGVTVILSGQGGDELFCGYRKYVGFLMIELFRHGRLLELVRQAAPWFLNGTLIPQWSTAEAGRYLPALLRKRQRSVIGEAFSGESPSFIGLGGGQSIQQRQEADLSRFSVPTLVHYEDRMSMAWSREVRLPFLDHRLIDVAIPAPTAWKLRSGWNKYALRKAVEPSLPAEVVWRRVRRGFTTPESGWIRAELQSAIGERLGRSAQVFERGLVNRAAFLALNAQMCAPGWKGSTVWGRDVFRVLALEIWLKRFADLLDAR